jgi:hypothetical protein
MILTENLTRTCDAELALRENDSQVLQNQLSLNGRGRVVA